MSEVFAFPRKERTNWSNLIIVEFFSVFCDLFLSSPFFSFIVFLSHHYSSYFSLRIYSRKSSAFVEHFSTMCNTILLYFCVCIFRVYFFLYVSYYLVNYYSLSKYFKCEYMRESKTHSLHAIFVYIYILKRYIRSAIMNAISRLCTLKLCLFHILSLLFFRTYVYKSL